MPLVKEPGAGAHLRDFDFARIEGLPPLEDVGQHSQEQMWERLTLFLRAIVPVAERAGLRLALHPNDPPVPVYRGVAQPLWNSGFNETSGGCNRQSGQ